MEEPAQNTIEGVRELVADCVRTVEAARIDAELARQRLEKAQEALRFANEALEQAVLSNLGKER